MRAKLVKDILNEEISYMNTCKDSYQGQSYMEAWIYLNKEPIGVVIYSLYNRKLFVDDIFVREEYRRKGYGSRLMKYIKEENPEYTYAPSFKTDLGAKFKDKDLSLKEGYSSDFLNWFGNSKIVDKQGNPLIVYHGSPNDFKEFMYKYIGKTGTSRGYGFYFTDIKEFAVGFKESDKGKLYEVYLKIIKPLDDINKKITKIQLEKFVKSLDPDGNEYLSNYGDIEHEGYDKILKRAIENEFKYNHNDVDLIHSIINANGSNFEKDYKILYKTLGYDGIILRNHDTMLYIAFFPWQIKSVNATKYSDSDNIYEYENRKNQ
jgi:GNAT superfamily N-acetyltransferase